MATYYVLDGTEYKEVSLDTIKKDNNFALESDVQTVKGAAEQRQKDMQTTIDDLTKKFDAANAAKLTAESALSDKEKELEPLKESASKLSGFEAQIKELTDKLSAAETQALTTRRTSILSKYPNLTDENKKKIESMTTEQLDSFEQAASILPVQQQQQNNNNGNNFDRGNGQGGQLFEGNSLSNIKAGLSELKVEAGSGSS